MPNLRVQFDPSTRAPASLDFARDKLAGGSSLGMSPPTRRGVVLSERSESKDDGSGAPGLPGGLHHTTQLLELFVGKPTTDNPQQRYAKRTDEPTIYAVTKDRVEALLQDPQTLRARTVLDFFANQATKVRVRWQDASWTIEKREGTWQLADDQQALDGSHVDEWLWKLRDVKLTRFVEDEPQSLSRYGLDPPKGTIQVWLTDQQESKDLLIGDAVGQGKARYGRIANRPSVVELPEIINELLTTKPESFKPSQPEPAPATSDAPRP